MTPRGDVHPWGPGVKLRMQLPETAHFVQPLFATALG
jgi:hypothetical protein